MAFMNLTLILFIIGVACILFEMFAGTLAVLWIGIGFILTSAVHFVTESILISLLIFIVSMLFALFATKRMKQKKTKTVVSGVKAYIGRQLRVEEIDTEDDKRGVVSLNGETWNCLATEPLQEKDMVEVYDVIGATLLVKKEEEF